MEHVTYTGSNQIKIERFQLAVYSIFNFALLLLSDFHQWASWNDYILLLGIVIYLIVHISQKKTYEFRAWFGACLMQGSIIFYALHQKELEQVLPFLMMSVVLFGLYGVAKIIYSAVISTIIIFSYHFFVTHSISFTSKEETMISLAQITIIILLEQVVYNWTKRNDEGSKQLLDVIEELKVVENSKDDFMANVSHEIRTPINSICGLSEIILQEELPYKVKENIQNIQIAGRNLMSVVSDILDFSELQSGKIELEEEAYNITSTINDVINMAMARKDEKKLELIVDCAVNIPCVLLGDEKKLRRVILNLVDNAIKFTEEGCVTIGVGFRKESYGINLSVFVKDTGIGIKEENLEKLFAGFNQVDSSRKRQEDGIGLGLAISQALVRKMGGAITVKSKPGKGTMVQFVVPQKVLDENPIVAIRDKETINVAVYIDMEQFEMAAIRDEYVSSMSHMMEQLKGKCHVCRNLAELQRREGKEYFSHIFISLPEYKEDASYFDSLAQKTNVVVVLNRFEEKYVTNPKLLIIYKPFYILTIVSALNGNYDGREEQHRGGKSHFVTKDVHILVVDDNRMNLRVIQELLSNYRIKVTAAISGSEALEKLTAEEYDFIFMDHMMPQMDGVETLHRIRHKVGAYFQRVPVVALTANAVAGTREMLLAEGFSDFLEKPVERSVLERVLKRNLPAEKLVYDEEAYAEETVTNEELVIEGLDVNKGILYCNGKEQYLSILRGYCEDWDSVGMMAQQSFAERDWKNYTIAVHGLKSAMRSIGATKLSETARLLEYAGKDGRIDYILEHHEEMMQDYRGLFLELRRNTLICPQEKNDLKAEMRENRNLPVLDDALFEQMMTDMEEAMYSLDGKRLSELVEALGKYRYHGREIKDILPGVQRKIEMSDYISAVETIVRWKRVADKEI